jgi:NtrC-family two-component system sensor histidine kinase KinB
MKWTLRKKILVGYGIALILMVLILAWSLANLRRLGRATDAILTENYQSILAAENMIDAIERQDSATLLVMLGYTDEGLAQFQENENQFFQWLGRAKDNITIEGEGAIVDGIEQGYSKYLAAFAGLPPKAQATSTSGAAFYHETVLPAFTQVRNECIRLRQINEKTMFQASERAEAFNFLGALLEIRGDRIEAQKNYRAALSLDPTYHPAQENLYRSTNAKPGGEVIFGVETHAE